MLTMSTWPRHHWQYAKLRTFLEEDHSSQSPVLCLLNHRGTCDNESYGGSRRPRRARRSGRPSRVVRRAGEVGGRNTLRRLTRKTSRPGFAQTRIGVSYRPRLTTPLRLACRPPSATASSSSRSFSGTNEPTPWKQPSCTTWVPRPRWRASLPYNEFYRPMGVLHQAGVYVAEGPGWAIGLALNRGGRTSDSPTPI